MSLSQSFSQKIGNVRPLNPCPSLDIDFANGGYVNTGGFANQASVGSANFKIGAFNGPDPIFTRASAATFRGSNGLIQYAPENLLQYSEQFDNVYWSKDGSAGITPNDAIAPNGTLTADKLSLPNAGGSQLYRVFPITSGPLTASIWIRANSPITLNFGFYDSTIDTIAINVTTEWKRFTYTRSVGFTSANGRACWLYNINAASSVVYIWGAQLERSSTARPYISTTTAARYGPRFEYDLSGNPLGLLMEEQSQNLIAQSENLTGNNWSVSNTTAAASASISPTGSSSFVVTETIAGGLHTFFNMGGTVANSLAVTSGTVYTGSFFLKKNSTVNWIQISFGGVGFGTTQYANFNLSTGAIGNYAGLTGSPKIENCGNGWYRCSISVAATATTTTNPAIISFTNNLDQAVRTPSYAGSTSNSVLTTMAQFEQKPFVTSYMPTVGGPMTRNADVVNSTIGSWYNTDEGTIVVKGDRTGFNIQDSLFEFTSGTTASLAHRGDGTDENFLVEDATTNVTIVETIPLNSPLYFAASYSDPATQVNATVNAEPVQGTTLASTITTPTTLNIGYSPEISTYFNGHIKAFRYYAKALPSKLESFTLTA